MWPGYIVSYLKGVIYDVKYRIIKKIQQAVQARMNVYQNASEFEEIYQTKFTIPELTMYREMKCIREAEYTYVYTIENNMKRY